MKKIFFIAILLFSLDSMAQVNLGMGRFGFFPANDTVAAGSSDTYDVWVKNYGPGVFNDYLLMVTAVRDSALPSQYDTVDIYTTSTPVVLNAGDSLLLTLTANYVVSPATYRYGIDVIVIWPVAASANTVDSLEFEVYVADNTGVYEPDAEQLVRAYPNPAAGILSVDHPDNAAIRSITIYDLSGKKVLSNSNECAIDTGSLASGTYHMEVILSDNKRYMIKFIKGKK
jgi:hypothetical protein